MLFIFSLMYFCQLIEGSFLCEDIFQDQYFCTATLFNYTITVAIYVIIL